MFFSRWSDASASSSEDEGKWPPPGRRKRHPAGNSYETACTFSDGSQSCISRLLDSPAGVTFQKGDEAGAHCGVFFANDECSRRVWIQDNARSPSTGSSSGFYSRQPTHSVGQLTSPFLFSPDASENVDQTTDRLISRFCQFRLNSEPPVDVDDVSLTPSSPPMLRRFLNAQITKTSKDCSYSCPSQRYSGCTDENLRT
ncbi:hypothetical protein P879_00992 [Paragonimus westermani]|uniref:Uncharacterized protein n=1 Tax=Paragonimus westermani TaxID=34504 RepID=A0A8T0DYP9_9TREM|nr:hypothetical protein P879_00992 [Paragonimus westermani]